MFVFLSYAREDEGVATEISMSLRTRDLEVFFDRATLGSGHAYDEKIQAAVKCDLFVFLISPDSVVEPHDPTQDPRRRHYTLTELQYAKQRWRK